MVLAESQADQYDALSHPLCPGIGTPHRLGKAKALLAGKRWDLLDGQNFAKEVLYASLDKGLRGVAPIWE